MSKFQDLTGQRFGRLTVIKRVENKTYPSGQKKVEWLCKCECGKETTVSSQCLLNGHTKSCGCTKGEFIRQKKATHKESNTKLYRIWQAMKRRCYNANTKDYKLYGSRGIAVCDEWFNSFEAFEKWAIVNGYDDTLTIDRIDVNGNYEPSNCRWATPKEQANNKRNNHLLTYNNKTQTLQQWADEMNIKRSTILTRLNRGWSIERALTKPIIKRKGV